MNDQFVKTYIKHHINSALCICPRLQVPLGKTLRRNIESSNIFFPENFQRLCLLIIFLNAYHIVTGFFI